MNQRSWMYGVPSLIVLGLACGSDNGPAGPGGGSSSNPAAAGFGALANAYAAVVEANAATYSSVATFGPLVIQSLLSPPPLGQRATKTGDAAQGSCLPASMQGIVFQYDIVQKQYVPGSGTGAPPDGARYTLYEVDENGSPVLPLVAAGYVDIACTAAADTVAMSIGNAADVNIMGIERLSQSSCSR